MSKEMSPKAIAGKLRKLEITPEETAASEIIMRHTDVMHDVEAMHAVQHAICDVLLGKLDECDMWSDIRGEEHTNARHPFRVRFDKELIDHLMPVLHSKGSNKVEEYRIYSTAVPDVYLSQLTRTDKIGGFPDETSDTWRLFRSEDHDNVFDPAYELETMHPVSKRESKPMSSI